MASPISNLVTVNGVASTQVGTSVSAPSPVIGIPLAITSAVGGAALAFTFAVVPSNVTAASADVALPSASVTSGEGQSLWGERTVDALGYAPGATLSAPVLDAVLHSAIALGVWLPPRAP